MKQTTFLIHSKKRENNHHLEEKLRAGLFSSGFEESSSPEIVFVLGGDGSLMRAIHCHGKNVKYCLINTGHLGFFSDYDAEELDTFLEDISKREPLEEKLPLYQLVAGSEKYEFVNDVSIQSNETCFLDIKVDGELLSSVRANGIVVSSPVGTTGYLTSLNSPIVVGKPDIYQYSTIAPCYNRLSINPINKAILASSQKLSVDVRKGLIEVYLDGMRREDIVASSYLFTKEEDKFITLLHFREISQVKRLRKNISGMED